MRQYKLYIAYIKNFEFKIKFELYYDYKHDQVALNTLKLLVRYFGFKSPSTTSYSKHSMIYQVSNSKS
jgi:hypothetical protein